MGAARPGMRLRLSGGMNAPPAASRSHWRLRRCVSRTGFEVLNPLGKNAKGPEWGLSHVGGEGGIRTRGTL